MSEVWRDVPSVSGILVSSEGRVMHIPHREAMPNGGERSYGGEPVWGVWNRDLCRFTISIRGVTYKVHKLVTEAFHGPPPFEGAVAMHVDENSANNRSGNLCWGTQKENLNAPGFLDYCRGRTGDDSPTRKGRNAKIV